MPRYVAHGLKTGVTKLTAEPVEQPEPAENEEPIIFF